MSQLTTIYAVANQLEYLYIHDVIQQHTSKNFLVILDKEKLSNALRILERLLPQKNTVSLPPLDTSPYDHSSPSLKCFAERMHCLTQLAFPSDYNNLIVVTCVEALIQKLPPKNILRQYTRIFEAGKSYVLSDLISLLRTLGYERVETVIAPGTFAQRGGLVDCFPVSFSHPLRLDFFGDELESIRTFDSETQRTLSTIKDFTLKPLSEVILDEPQQLCFRQKYRRFFGIQAQNDLLYENIAQGIPFQGMEHFLSLFYTNLETPQSYMADFHVIHMTSLVHQAESVWEKIQNNFHFRKDEAETHYKTLPPQELYIEPRELQKSLSSMHTTVLDALDGPNDTTLYRPLFPLNAKPSFTEIAEAFLKKPQDRITIATSTEGNKERIQKLMAQHHINARTFNFITVPFPRSFKTSKEITLTERDLLEFTGPVERSTTKKQNMRKLLEMSEFQVGDFLVHEEHGIGKYVGLENIQIHNASHDCLCLIYQEDNKLFLPVENIDLLSFYASKNAEVSLDYLGRIAWQMRKAKAKKRIQEMAEKLIRIAAQRKLSSAHPFWETTNQFEAFCRGFAHAETEDQARAIEDVIEDLSKSIPMDRLICGDVGFGKTEVALRAAFLVASQKAQVAILAPTTLLARQHYEVFKKRFRDFPLSVSLMSRFQSTGEIKKIKSNLAQGDIDIVIGTHALLTPHIQFQNLGLLIIDEEQHFGVQQKEKLKEKYPHAHSLALSATPIPRTLQMAIAGIRDLSLITTPPLERQPVPVKITPFDKLIIKEALQKEKERGGQSFFVCPRVTDIPKTSLLLKELLPSFKIIEAHGQMLPKTLEDTIIKFCAGQYDILISTNIVESGLDIPSANTLIVYRSDLFGLAQLYQLRGRVGRGKLQGYAYFTVTPDKMLSLNAQRRLEVLQNLTGLGGGFTIAGHDMDIRGTGNLVGEEQSGQIKEVGIGLYQHMLEEAIQQLKNTDTPHTVISEEWTPQINLGLEILIPETYIDDLNLRLGLYQRIGHLKTEEEVDAFRAEIRDRFGPVPTEADNLLSTVSLKNICKSLHIQKIDSGPNGVLISFYKDTFPWPDKLLPWIQSHLGTIRLRPDQKIVLLKAWSTPQKKLEGIYQVLSQLL